MNTYLKSMHEELWNGFRSRKVLSGFNRGRCMMSEEVGTLWNTASLFQFQTLLDEVFNDGTLPRSFSRVGGHDTTIANTLKDELFRKVSDCEICSAHLPNLLAKYAFAYCCLLGNFWDIDGPTASFLAFRDILLLGYTTVNQTSEFSKLVVKFHDAMKRTEPSREMLGAYLSSSILTCETKEDILANINRLTLLILVIVMAKNLKCDSAVIRSMVTLFRGTKLHLEVR